MNIEARAKAEAELPTVKPVTQASTTVFDKLPTTSPPTAASEKPSKVKPTRTETVASKGSADNNKKSNESKKNAAEKDSIDGAKKIPQSALPSELSSSKDEDATMKRPKSEYQVENGLSSVDQPTMYSAAYLYKPNVRGPELKYLILFIASTLLSFVLTGFFIYGEATKWKIAETRSG